MKDGILTWICLLITCGVLTAGLWPFHAPRNQVTWLGTGNGVHFGEYGSILSNGTFGGNYSPNEVPCSLEIWFRPDDLKRSNTFLAFYVPENPLQFSLAQYKDELLIRRRMRDDHHRLQSRTFEVENIFRGQTASFITITSDTRRSLLFLDGKLVNESERVPLSNRELTGRLVLGNSPVNNNGLPGRLLGLAIYSRELTSEQVLRHFRIWTSTGRPDVDESDGAVAVYPFDERSGTIARNQIKPGLDLSIPAQYVVLAPKFLDRPWNEFRASWSYLQDILINIAGFIPLGFFYLAFLSAVHPTIYRG